MEWRRTIFCIMLALMAAGVAAAETWCCQRQGARLEYVRSDSGTGKTVWTHTMRIISVTDRGDTVTVVAASDFKKGNGKSLSGQTVRETFKVCKADNSVTVGLGQAAAGYASFRTGLDIEDSGSEQSVMPASLESGDRLPDVCTWVGYGPVRCDITIYDRKILRRETLTCPAGTFDCIVIEEYRKEDAPMRHRQIRNISWYARGVGYVRHDTYNAAGTLETIELLVNFQ